MKKELIAVLAVGMFTGAAFAMDDSAMKSSGKMSFESMDTDSNGQISRAEWDAGKAAKGAMGHSDKDAMGHSSGDGMMMDKGSEGVRDGDTVVDDGSAPGGGGNTTDQPAP